MNSVGACSQCGGAGVTSAGLPCPACGGVKAPAKPRTSNPGTPAKPQQAADRGKSLAIHLDLRTWERVTEAARLNGCKPGAWARDALLQAASQQIHKALQRQRAEAGDGGKA